MDFDELKKEKKKQSLYGFIESSILLNSKSGEKQKVTKRQTVQVTGGAQGQLVQSKIIGNFVPRNSTNTQTVTSRTSSSSSGSDRFARILELVERATAAVNVTNKF